MICLCRVSLHLLELHIKWYIHTVFRHAFLFDTVGAILFLLWHSPLLFKDGLAGSFWSLQTIVGRHQQFKSYKWFSPFYSQNSSGIVDNHVNFMTKWCYFFGVWFTEEKNNLQQKLQTNKKKCVQGPSPRETDCLASLLNGCKFS